VKVAVDTNILAYAEGVNGQPRKETTNAWLEASPIGDVVIPAQVLGELFNVLIRKAGRSRADARAAVLAWRNAYPVVDTSADVLTQATRVATQHGLSIWDAVVLAAASTAGCHVLLSEDLRDGFTWGGVTVVNPYAVPATDSALPDWLR
jgi:predicted nucleic acid-binding protein